MIKPQKLNPGDKVAAISLSWGGPGTFPHRYQAGVRQLQEAFDLEVVGSPHVLAEDSFLHANPQARAEDLMAAFADPSIKAIFSTIGGDDSIRILPYLDLDTIRSNPKIFMGYSDTTITHLACFKTGLVSFYGPAIMAGFGENGGLFPYMVDSVRKTLFSAEPIGTVPSNTEGWTVEFLDWANPEHQDQRRRLTPSTGWEFIQGSGVNRGHLLGGNIDVLDWLRGTEFWPSRDQWQDAILFLETSEGGITPDQLKYNLRPYLALGVFEELSGILFGRPGGQIPPDQFPEYDRILKQVVAQEAGRPDIPIITRMDFGHTDPMFVLPYGLQAEIDCEAGTFTILENAVEAC